MRIVKYKVRLPNPDNTTSFTDFEYDSPLEVCSALKIARSTMYAIIRGDSKLAQKNLRHLKGIQIIRIPADSVAPCVKTPQQINEEIKQAQKLLFEQLTNYKQTTISTSSIIPPSTITT